MLHAYMGYAAFLGPEEFAVLIFANNRQEAKKIGARSVQDFGDCSYQDVRVKRLNGDCAHLRKCGAPHVVESPPACTRCERWKTEPLDSKTGLCVECLDEMECPTCSSPVQFHGEGRALPWYCLKCQKYLHPSELE